MCTDLPPLIAALLQAQRYPGGVKKVELVQTHISWVLLAGDFAYKIKKPVQLSFLDFSTLALRQKYCQDELRLNRRFAPDLYLEVVGIFNTPQDPLWGGQGEPIEFAVKMCRFDESQRLDRVCQRGQLGVAHLSALADALVAFHESAEVAGPDSRYGTAQHILAPALGNFTDLLNCLPASGLQTRLMALRAWTQAQFQRLAPVMQSRQQAGWVRECHGDLHLANMVLINGRVQMFDCIEFNQDLRWMDVASEIAFVYIDLLAHAQPGLADWFVDEVLSRNGDYEAAKVLRFYAVYRAMVRAKVAALRWQQTKSDPSEIERYVVLAEQLTVTPALRLVITHGLSGCGKTVASDALLQSDPQAATLRLRSDVQRKRLFGLSRMQSSGSALHSGIYAADAHERTYSHLRELAAMLLRAGWSVVVDAAFLKRADRDSFCRLARDLGADFAILAPTATPELLRERILARTALGHDASEATLEVLAQQMLVLEPLEAGEKCDQPIPMVEPLDLPSKGLLK
jgi:aminoglycoside phosphotransferase family enzyme/predicted kinase